MMIRWSYPEAMLGPSIGLAIAVVEDIARGRTAALQDPLFLGAMLASVLVVSAILWLIPFGRVTNDGVTAFDTLFRLKTISWSDVTRCKYWGMPGFRWLRIYAPQSRYAVWLYLPHFSRSKVRLFILSSVKAPAVLDELQKIGV